MQKDKIISVIELTEQFDYQLKNILSAELKTGCYKTAKKEKAQLKPSLPLKCYINTTGLFINS
ncbi:MAG: hypothetical protein WBP45_01690 [Daejeonella sp.]